ncbi:uncharacterized protein LOC119400588 [Rhipicephalus sanguineus]|uniref:uncharacterized protein LOC119400588 n=1 Tax=Rhipicephalus sanguineus TaxID=34632 RepID=UPI0018961AE3|nr:uncharacterized protein LOC119400588 [Rhipicephalus sanguineus]
MERIKSKRTTQRALHTRLQNEARQLIESSQFSSSDLRVVHHRLKVYNDGLWVLNLELEGYLTHDQVAEHYVSVAEYEDNAAATLSLLCHHMEELKAPASRTADSAATNDVENEGIATAGSRALVDQMRQGLVGSRLPKLEMLHFNGSLTQCQPFWDMFKHAVHENPSLTNIEWFHYLKNLLTGQAAKAIDGIQATEGSYEGAITLLTNRFGNKKIIEQNFLANLRTIKLVKSSTYVGSLRSLLDTVHINIRGLKALGCPALSYDAMLVEVLTKAIPGDILVEYFKQQSRKTSVETLASSEAELQERLDYVRMEVEARERSALWTPLVMVPDINDKGRFTTLHLRLLL